MPTLIRLSPNSSPGEDVDFSAVFDAVPEPLAYIGPGHRLEACNRRFRELFPTLIEERLLQALPSAQVPATLSGREASGMRPLVAKGHSFQPRATPMADGGLLVSFENVEAPPDIAARALARDLRARLEDAQAALERAEARARARKMALAAAGHELRAPLNAILGFAEMMEKEMFGPLGHDRYREYAAMIGESGGYLLALVNDFLEMARLDAGKTRLHLAPVQVLKVVVDCMKVMEPQARGAEIGLSVRVYDGVEQVVGDELRLHQMVLNLLSNAVKFTPKGGEAGIDIFRQGRFVAISISDSGKGIAPADLIRVLEPFERAENTAAPGTGLGLPLTQALTRLHGGELKLESVVGQGTTTTILLPPEGPAAGRAGLQ